MTLTIIDSPQIVGTQINYEDTYATGDRSMYSVKYGLLRTDVDDFKDSVEIDHNEDWEVDLAERAFRKQAFSIQELLTELSEKRGLSWSLIAEVAGVSVSAIRKWRAGKPVTKTNLQLLARYAAMLDLVSDKGRILDPGSWMEIYLPFSEISQYLRPLDLYLQGHVTGVLNLAQERKSVSRVLDDIDPDWRRNRSEFIVFEDSDGGRSIKLRGRGE